MQVLTGVARAGKLLASLDVERSGNAKRRLKWMDHYHKQFLEQRGFFAAGCH